MNEIAQWIAIALLLVLVLGLFRQLSMFMAGRGPRSLESISGPPVNKKLPSSVLARLSEEHCPAPHGRTVLAFIEEACAGCRRLLGKLSDQQHREELHRVAQDGFQVVLIARRPSPEFLAALQELDVPVIPDSGTLWSSCNIQATPSLVTLNSDGVVLTKVVDHRVERALAHVG